MFAGLREIVAHGHWSVPPAENGRPAPGLYLALLSYNLSRSELEALINRLKIYRDDLALLHQVSDLKQREADLEQEYLSNHEIYALLRHSSSPALMILWLCTGSVRVRERLWYYETELRHVQTEVDGEYLKGLGLKPSPLFGKLLNAVRDARLDGEIQTVEEEKALIARLLAERKKG